MGQTFYLSNVGNWGLINFQRSTKSSAEAVIFTVNLGIASGRLLRFSPPMRFRDVQPTPKPLEYECHWRRRLGQLLPNTRDTWWTISAETSLNQLTQDIQGCLLDLAFPELQRYIHDESLRDLWLSGHAPGLTELERLRNVSVLLKALGPQERLAPILQELQRSAGISHAGVTKLHMQRIEREEIT